MDAEADQLMLVISVVYLLFLMLKLSQICLILC